MTDYTLAVAAIEVKAGIVTLTGGGPYFRRDKFLLPGEYVSLGCFAGNDFLNGARVMLTSVKQVGAGQWEMQFPLKHDDVAFNADSGVAILECPFPNPGKKPTDPSLIPGWHKRDLAWKEHQPQNVSLGGFGVSN